jgi:hypothetical protein
MRPRSSADAAQKLGEQGESTQVCIMMGEQGHFRPEWTYGKDPYPPRDLASLAS